MHQNFNFQNTQNFNYTPELKCQLLCYGYLGILKGILLIRKRPVSRISGCILPQLTNPVLG